MWDEVHMAKLFNYSEAKDCVIGFSDHGKGGVKGGAADKALVYMVQSITKAWKQPVAYYFSAGDVPGDVLAELVTCILAALQEIGFDIRVSVSDQGTNNRVAVALLRGGLNPPKSKRHSVCASCKAKKRVVSKAKKKRVPGQPKGDAAYFSRVHCKVCRANSLLSASAIHYKINKNIKVYHMWDVPHLLKNLRTNFQKYNVEFDDGKVAKWVHLEKLRQQDGIDGTFYAISLKLTDKHLKFSHNGDKMSVPMAAQVLSNKVATALRKIDDWSEGKAIPGCRDTGDFIHFCDRLFDSFNGFSPRGRGKALRVNLSDDSPPIEFWKEAKAKIKAWWFVNATQTIPSHLGWLENIETIQGLRKDMKDDYQLQYLNLRKLNQDPLENLFSVVKANGA